MDIDLGNITEESIKKAMTPDPMPVVDIRDFILEMKKAKIDIRIIQQIEDWNKKNN